MALVALACGGPTETRLVVLGTTDVHGHLLPYDYATGRAADGSLAQVATLVDSIRAVEPNVLLVDSGDLLQGTPLNELQAQERAADGHPVISAMNALAYDASALGNHEFNYGLEYLHGALEPAAFPFLAANVYRSGTDSLVWPPYEIIERGGIRIGVIGFTTPGVAVWDRTHVEGRLDFRDIVESARRWVPRARADGAELLIVAAHSGVGPGSSYGSLAPEENTVARLAIEVPGIDVIFGGHTASPIAGRRIGGTLILHAGRHADHLAVADLTVRQTARGVEVSGDGRLIPTAGVPAADRIVSGAREAHARTLTWLDEPIGYTPDRWRAAGARAEDTPIVDLIARVQAEATGAELSAVAAFRTEAEFGPGPITRRDVLGLYVYPNTLRAVRISGAELRAYLERSARYFRTLPADRIVNDSVPGYNYDMVAGLDYALDLRRPPGERVVELRFGGAPVMPTDSFTLALNSYRQSGGGGFDMVVSAPVVYADETPIADRILRYVAGRDTLRTRDVFRRNWELRPADSADRVRAETGG